MLFSQRANTNRKMARELNVLKFYFLVRENCDYNALTQAFQALLRNNDSLRIRFCRRLFHTRQYITDYEPYVPERIKLNSRSEFDTYLESTRMKELPMYHSPLYWASLVDMGDCGALVMRISHFCIDGFSISLIFSQLEKYYKAFAAGEPEPKIRTYSIVDYFKLDNEYTASNELKEDRAYWQQVHKHQPEYQPPVPFAISGKSKRINCCIDGERYAALSSYCSQHMMSMSFMTNLLAALTTYVMTGSNNFCMLVMSHGRRNFKMKQTVGCMINYVPMYFHFETGKTLDETATEHYLRYMEALTHGRLPLSVHNPMTFGEAFKHKMNFGHFCWLLFSAMDYHSAVKDPLIETGTLDDTTLSYHFYCAAFDDPGERITLEVSHLTSRYSPEVMQKAAETMIAIADRIIANSSNPVENLKNKI